MLDNFLASYAHQYYLHSANNYSESQKSFNNNLTHMFISYAFSQGYVFNQSFTFEMIRNRVRCYYNKSFRRRILNPNARTFPPLTPRHKNSL